MYILGKNMFFIAVVEGNFFITPYTFWKTHHPLSPPRLLNQIRDKPRAEHYAVCTERENPH